MAFSFSKFKNILNTNKDSQLAGSGSLDPEIGFKLSLNPVSKCLQVTVIGARHLPSFFGLTRAHGYLVKVKLFPGDSKFETELQENSWPVWNEEFRFQLKQKDGKDAKKDLASMVAGHFVSFTIYAVLEDKKPVEDKKKGKTLDVLARMSKVQPQPETSKTKPCFFEKKMFSSFKCSPKPEVTQRSVMEKRRTIGAATWNFDSKLFQNDLRNGFVGTPDIWRPIKAITSGISGSDPRRENKKGQVEVSLLYTSSEDDLNDVITITVLRLRCSVTTMQEHEKLKAPLYLKTAITEEGKSETNWKSERFLPTISARWDPKTSFAKLQLFRSSLSKVTISISLGCKNKLSQKEFLGRAMVGADTAYKDNWNQCLRTPGTPVIVWLNLE